MLSGPCIVGAQTCVGLPGPEGGRIQLGAGYASTTGASQFTVYAGGVGSSLFGQASTTTANYDGWRGWVQTEGVSAGYRLPIGTRGTTELCPLVGGSLGKIVNEGVSEADGERRVASTRGASVGVSLGYRVYTSNTFAVIPGLSARFMHASLRHDDIELEHSNNYGLMRFSIGLVLGTRVTAYPSVSVPVGLEGANRSLGLAFTWSLRPKKP